MNELTFSLELKKNNEKFWLENNITACGLCGSGLTPVFGSGALGAEIMIVKDRPEAEEVAGKRAFAGIAENTLTAAFEALSLNYESCYLTNAAKCLSKPERHGDEQANSSDACSAYLAAEFSLIDPLFVLVLGQTAWESVSSALALSPFLAEGQAFKWREQGYLVRTLNPVHALTDLSDKRRLWEHLKAFAKVIDRKNGGE